MIRGVSRREALKLAGLGGVGLTAAAAATEAVASYRTGTLTAAELARLPRLADDVRPTDHAARGRDEVLKGLDSGPPLAARLIERQLSPGAGLEALGLDVREVVAEFVCDPRRPNVLLDGVRRITYEVVELAWQAGEGWPVYRQRTPHAEPAFGMRYAGVPRHQVVFLDEQAVYVGNPGACGVIADIRGPLCVDVNGQNHDQHRGFYKILITGLA